MNAKRLWFDWVIWGFYLFGLVSLYACATQQVDRNHTSLLWAAHQAKLSHVESWRLQARIGIRRESDSWHATLYWQQHGEDIKIRIIGPLGQGSMFISGNQNGVMIKDSKGGKRFSREPESLLLQQFGIRLPIYSLRYWILGLPAPAQSFEHELDANGQLKVLQQKGWSLDLFYDKDAVYQAYPAKVLLQSEGWDVRLAAIRWLEVGLKDPASLNDGNAIQH